MSGADRTSKPCGTPFSTTNWRTFVSCVMPSAVTAAGAVMRGARLTVSPGLSSRTVMNDTRLKAAVGYVPYFGQPLLPAFGRNEEGLQDMQMPYLAIAGG